MPKRNNYIGWDEYFMGVALLSGERSKDPSSQVGACIVSEDNKILSIGYNGFPNGCSDDEVSWEREGKFAETKYPYVCHGELNAILNYTGTTLKKQQNICSTIPMQRMCKGNNTIRHKRNNIQIRQIRRNRQHKSIKKNARYGTY